MQSKRSRGLVERLEDANDVSVAVELGDLPFFPVLGLRHSCSAMRRTDVDFLRDVFKVVGAVVHRIAVYVVYHEAGRARTDERLGDELVDISDGLRFAFSGKRHHEILFIRAETSFQLAPLSAATVVQTDDGAFVADFVAWKSWYRFEVFHAINYNAMTAHVNSKIIN